MGEFISGLICIALGLTVSLLVIGLSSVTISTATFWYWLPALVGFLVALGIWTCGEFLDMLD
jgi:lipopolysaccharide export LptBFGC system permease protein LptF